MDRQPILTSEEDTMSELTMEKQFADKLRERREQIKMNQSGLAELLGVPVERLDAWEAGNTADLTLGEIGRIASVLGTSVGALTPETDSDLDDGVLITPPDQQPIISGVREGVDYYVYRCLTRTRTVPSLVPLVVDVLVDDPEQAKSNHGHTGHEFIYVLEGEIHLKWGPLGRQREAVLETGASLYLQPYVPHSFTAAKGTGGAKLLAVNF
jgi:(S)-2-hydroxypropylphosphonic acid epoxidase